MERLTLPSVLKVLLLMHTTRETKQSPYPNLMHLVVKQCMSKSSLCNQHPSQCFVDPPNLMHLVVKQCMSKYASLRNQHLSQCFVDPPVSCYQTMHVKVHKFTQPVPVAVFRGSRSKWGSAHCLAIHISHTSMPPSLKTLICVISRCDGLQLIRGRIPEGNTL